MAYIINLTNGDPLVTVDDGKAVFNSASIALIGKNYAGYGEYLNENAVHMLENFARDTSPSNPLRGQLWYDTNTGTVKVYHGSTTQFQPVGNNVTPDSTSSTIQYVTFVNKADGTAPQPALKVNAAAGITHQPSTGKVGINLNRVAQSQLEINAGTATRTMAASTDVANNIPVRVIGADDAFSVIFLDSFGNTGASTESSASGTFCRKARGTSASPAALQSGNFIGGFGSAGYNGTSFVTNGLVSFKATENYSAGAAGSELVIYNVGDGQTTLRPTATFKSNGDLDILGDVVAYATSDSRLKQNVQVIDQALDRVMQLDGVTFNWTDQAAGKDTDVSQVGLLAQQVVDVLPEAVQEKPNGYMGVAYEKVIPLLVEAIKALRLEVQQLKSA